VLHAPCRHRVIMPREKGDVYGRFWPPEGRGMA